MAPTTTTGTEVQPIPHPSRDSTTSPAAAHLICRPSSRGKRANLRKYSSDAHFREKIFHFDHERIPERVVHARGSGLTGFFELRNSRSDVTRADILQRIGEKTEAFLRFSQAIVRARVKHTRLVTTTPSGSRLP